MQQAADPDAAFERQFVHDVYEEIAPHFSQTRYKPWPVIEKFITNLHRNTVVADIGCGNGKYQAVEQADGGRFFIGSDRSRELISIAAKKHPEADNLIADGLCLPYRDNCIDNAICVAVIHHFSTFERRVLAVREMLRVITIGGRVLIYVWALEQLDNSKRKSLTDDNTQDVMVPWQFKAVGSSAPSVEHKRYYHFFKKGELEDTIMQCQNEFKLRIAECGYDNSNWYAVVEKLETYK